LAGGRARERERARKLTRFDFSVRVATAFTVAAAVVVQD
jgi:hypothetical protein